MDEEGFVPSALHPRGVGKHGRVSTFLINGFQIRLLVNKMAPELQQYTAFMVGNLGFYEFTHMPFGLCNAPVTFQCLMQNTLRELNLTYCVIYLDDVIIFGRMEEEHLEHLCMEFPGIQPEARAFKVLIFPARNCLPGSPCLVMGHPAKP